MLSNGFSTLKSVLKEFAICLGTAIAGMVGFMLVVYVIFTFIKTYPAFAIIASLLVFSTLVVWVIRSEL